ncbi:ATP-binding cassette domain-containing protein [Nitratireductor sp. CAU 1489]|uniref:ATP-binding cassette domain-containing protein n=1 Tax=Nitratireductor arenosus TaxID=2682096 RepID=A0A844QFW5_9HYPH|nr:oligopeptide/dipeptide ABC transporter ATP-binding protein [Nitratireductor arenosus]MVA96968.1 ATP-binding cassette domain-containing protein [Nitratireductor arenosus]
MGLEPPVLAVENVFKRYQVSRGLLRPKRSLQAVRGVSLSVDKQRTLGIVGESGCGKSTLARMLLNLERPDEGDILLDGRSAGTVGRLDFSARVQPVFQDPYSTLNPRRTILETVMHPLRVHARGERNARETRAARLLDLVGLPRRAHHAHPNQLSGGQRQRVAIARALVLEPQVLICDEPTSALDVSIQAQILNLIQELQKEFGISIVFISHNLAVVEHLCDEVAVMYLGRVVENGPTADVMASPRHPYTKALLDSVLTPDVGLGLPDLQLGLEFPDPTNVPPGCAFHPRCPHREPVCSTEVPPACAQAGHGSECHFADRLAGAFAGPAAVCAGRG